MGWDAPHTEGFTLVSTPLTTTPPKPVIMPALKSPCHTAKRTRSGLRLGVWGFQSGNPWCSTSHKSHDCRSLGLLTASSFRGRQLMAGRGSIGCPDTWAALSPCLAWQEKSLRFLRQRHRPSSSLFPAPNVRRVCLHLRRIKICWNIAHMHPSRWQHMCDVPTRLPTPFIQLRRSYFTPGLGLGLAYLYTCRIKICGCYSSHFRVERYRIDEALTINPAQPLFP